MDRAASVCLTNMFDVCVMCVWEPNGSRNVDRSNEEDLEEYFCLPISVVPFVV